MANHCVLRTAVESPLPGLTSSPPSQTQALGQECSRRFGPGVYDPIVPTVLRIGSYRFHFYSDEGMEPAHIHVRTNDGEAKFWLDPTIGLARNHGVRPMDLRRIEQLVFEHHDQLLRAFNEFHNR